MSINDVYQPKTNHRLNAKMTPKSFQTLPQQKRKGGREKSEEKRKKEVDSYQKFYYNCIDLEPRD